MAKPIEGSIEWDVRQIEYCIEWMLVPIYFGFSKEAAVHTLNLYCDRIERSTQLADNWDWNRAWIQYLICKPDFFEKPILFVGFN